ncbi:MAG: secretin and TonB N-terminal domain-containing protein, partial [Nitrospirota bacterium]|nr:secretin and TonB N-terminal domain-containing protein [Nitrospirota bacterium]
TGPYRGEAVETIESENPLMPLVQEDATPRVAQRATATVRRASTKFHVRPVQMASDADGGEKNTPKEDLVVGDTRYVGRRISLDFQQADISNVLRLIAEVSGFNMVVGEGVKSKVTMKLVSVPWDQALDMILKMNGLGKIRQGNILWIDSLANIAKQQNEEAQAKDAKAKAEELVDRVFYIRNLQATELMTSLRQYLSPRGLMQMSVGSNALIVRDTESKIAVMKQLVDGLDLQVPQVQIEARIVQADTTYSRSLGVQWGVQNVNQLGNGGVANFKTGVVGPFGNQASDFLVNLPATVGGLVATPGAGFTIGRTDGALLDVRLSAGELLGLSKVIAAPKVTTLDKREAKISQGES